MAEGITLPDTIVEDIMHIYAGYPDHMGTSMYYDVINHQPLEVEAIQGFIYRKARTHHLYAIVRYSLCIITVSPFFIHSILMLKSMFNY